MQFERSILVVAALATAAFLAAGVYSFFDPGIEELRLHVLLTLGAVLLVVFPHLWIALYLVATGRAVRREAAAGRADEAAVAEARRHLRRTLPPLVLAILAALATIAVGHGILTGTTKPWHHIATFALAVVLQLWALLIERKHLTQNASLLTRLDSPLTPSFSSPPS